MNVLLELLAVAGVVAKLPPWLTMLGVAWLILQERRRARRHAQLEELVQLLAKGHAGDVDAHRTLPAKLLALQEKHAHADR